MSNLVIKDYHVRVSNARKCVIREFVKNYPLPLIGLVDEVKLPDFKVNLSSRSNKIIYGAETYAFWKGKTYHVLIYPKSSSVSDRPKNENDSLTRLHNILSDQRVTAVEYLLATLPKNFSRKAIREILALFSTDKHDFYMIVKHLNPRLKGNRLRSIVRQLENRYREIIKMTIQPLDEIAELDVDIIIIPEDVSNVTVFYEFREMGISKVEVLSPENDAYKITKLIDVCMEFDLEPVVGSGFRIDSGSNYSDYLKIIQNQIEEIRRLY